METWVFCGMPAWSRHERSLLLAFLCYKTTKETQIYFAFSLSVNNIPKFRNALKLKRPKFAVG